LRDGGKVLGGYDGIVKSGGFFCRSAASTGKRFSMLVTVADDCFKCMNSLLIFDLIRDRTDCENPVHKTKSRAGITGDLSFICNKSD